MPRIRKPLRYTIEGVSFVCRFRHPVTKKWTRANLGRTGNDADRNLQDLNRVFLDPNLWIHLPNDISDTVREIWEPDVPLKARHPELDPEDESVLKTRNQYLEAEVVRLKRRDRELLAELEQWRGAKVRDGPAPTLEAAIESWSETYRGLSERHRRNVLNDLGLFANEFGPDTSIGDFAGKEAKLNAWLADLKVSAGRRAQIRTYVLKLLRDNLVVIDRKAIRAPKAKEIRDDRGGINWLEKDQASDPAEALEPYFEDCFRIQVALGLRPHELLTLHRENFAADLTSHPSAPWTPHTENRVSGTARPDGDSCHYQTPIGQQRRCVSRGIHRGNLAGSDRVR